MRKLAFAVIMAVANAAAAELFQTRFFVNNGGATWGDAGTVCTAYKLLVADDPILAFGKVACKAVSTCLFLTQCGGQSSFITMVNGSEVANAPNVTNTNGCIGAANVGASGAVNQQGSGGWLIWVAGSAGSDAGLFTPMTSVSAYTNKYCLDFGTFKPNGEMSLGGVYTEYAPLSGVDEDVCRQDYYGNALAYIRAFLGA